MSVGGLIVDVVEVSPSKWWINTIQNSDWKLTLTPEQLAKRAVAVYCDPAGERPAVGDVLWWQAGQCYWTPDDRSRVDVKLRKIGGSGVRHPHRPTWESEQGSCPAATEPRCDCGTNDPKSARYGHEHIPWCAAHADNKEPQ